MSSLPEAVPKSLSAFYYFMKEKGFPIVSGAYEHGDDGFVCIVFFDPSVTIDKLWKFLNLPKVMSKTSDKIMSMDNSWFISKDDGIVSLSLDEPHHVGVMCYIMANR